MGCDGGTIPTRGELVRTKKKPEQISKEVDLLVKWKHCAISQEPLQPPIVACQLGRLYNKDAVIELLLDRSKMEATAKFDHIKTLKDVKALQLTANPARTRDGESGGKAGPQAQHVSPFICPITGLEMNGRYKFCYLLTCACVFSDRALKQLRDSSACSTCGRSFSADDVITINGTEEEVEDLRTRMDQRRQQAKQSRNLKRTKVETITCVKTEPGNDADSGACGSSSVSSEDQGSNSMPRSDECPTAPPGDASTVAATGDSDGSSDGPARKKIKLDVDSDLKLVASSSTASDTKLVPSSSRDGRSKLVSGKSKDKKPASIQKDPNATSTYKSLFSSHPTAKNQSKAHWVTYNPFYN